MKKVFLLLLLPAFIFSCKDADKSKTENGNNATSTDAAAQANAALDSTSLTNIQWLEGTDKDLGKIKTGQTAEVTYNFVNNGDKPLIIKDVRPGCGCTVAQKPDQPIMPGKEGKIVAQFNTTNQGTGPHSKSITVSANTAPTPEHMLTFKADIIP